MIENILSSFKYQHLPSLRQRTDNEIRRIMNIDNYQIGLNVNTFKEDNDISDFIKFSQIYIIIYNEKDSIKNIENMCDEIWNTNKSMSNCVLLTNTKKSIKNVSDISQKWNIPYISVFDENKGNDLFTFAVKYFWFCSANNQ